MKKTLTLALTAGLLLPALSGCVQETASSTSEVVFVGLMGAPKVLDPAGTRSFEDAALLQQLFPSVMNSDTATGKVVPELGVSAEYTAEFEYSVELKPDLTFSNGHALTASDVAHSINRIKSINDPNGPAVMLQSVESVEVVGDTTVVFKPTRGFDQALPALLAGLPGLVVDEEVFPADRLLSNGEVAGSNAFAGPYTLAGYNEGSAARINPNPVYAGIWGVPKNKGVELRYYSNADQLMFDSSEMLIDVALVHRQSLTGATGDAAQTFAIEYVTGPNVETGMLLLNAASGVFAESNFASAREAAQVRSIFMSAIDASTLVGEVYGQLYESANAIVPVDLGGTDGKVEDEETGSRGSTDKLSDLEIEAPLQVKVSFPETAYGVAVPDLMARLKATVEKSKQFEVILDPLSDAEFEAARSDKSYEVLFDFHYPVYADPEAFLYPILNAMAASGASPERISDQTAALAQADTDDYREHLSDSARVGRNLIGSEMVKPLLWAGRHALVRDGINGGDVLLGGDGKLVLAALYRTVLN